tara:strand:+ start:481 stop:669 length:189 start_codon:yes stop_codon:yes gene_type:complete
MNFNQANHKYRCFMREYMNHMRELEEPNENESKSNSNGFWLLKTITGSNLAIVSEEGEVELL